MDTHQTLEWLAKAARDLSFLSQPTEIMDFFEARMLDILPDGTCILFSHEDPNRWVVQRIFGAEADRVKPSLDGQSFVLDSSPVPGHIHRMGDLSEWLGLSLLGTWQAHFLPFANVSGGVAFLTRGNTLSQTSLLETFAHQCAFFLRTKEVQTPPPPPYSLRVLLAEDNVVNQKMALRLLEKRGHQVTVVGNGLEAIRRWQNQPFDLILMDIQMPQMGGIEAARRIRAAEMPGARIPILAVTAHSTWADQDGLMDGFVLKPIQAGTLLREINNRVRPPSVTNPPVVRKDAQNILKDLDEELELIRELLYSLMEEVPRQVGEIRQHLANRDAAQLLSTTQVVKGALGNFAADTILQAARAIEMKVKMIRGPIADYASGKAWGAAYSLELLAKQGEPSACQEAFDDLEIHIERLLAALKDFV